VAARAEGGYGVASEVVDGNDAEAVHAAAAAAAARCRAGQGPFVLEAETYRWHGHYEGDAQPYKPEDESAGWRDRDPLVVHGRRLVQRGDASENELEVIRDDARRRVDDAVERARSLDAPPPEEAFAHVFGD
jgi:pyruvate dehydrogenase E1 component alpha subunit